MKGDSWSWLYTHDTTSEFKKTNPLTVVCTNTNMHTNVHAKMFHAFYIYCLCLGIPYSMRGVKDMLINTNGSEMIRTTSRQMCRHAHTHTAVWTDSVQMPDDRACVTVTVCAHRSEALVAFSQITKRARHRREVYFNDVLLFGLGSCESFFSFGAFLVPKELQSLPIGCIQSWPVSQWTDSNLLPKSKSNQRDEILWWVLQKSISLGDVYSLHGKKTQHLQCWA